MTDAPKTLGTRWLFELLTEAGLEPDRAKIAAGKVRGRMLRRVAPAAAPRSPGAAMRDRLVGDPLVSFNRLVGASDDQLPFIDGASNRLSEVAFATVLSEAGLDADVGLAFAKVVVELATPEALYEPIWVALGGVGPVDLPRLRRMDWSPLRRSLALSRRQGGAPRPRVTGAQGHPRRRAPLTASSPTAPLERRQAPKPRPASGIRRRQPSRRDPPEE